MILNSAVEIIELQHYSSISPAGVTYAPQFISTDRRKLPGEKTTLGYYQVGDPNTTGKIGNTSGPIYRMEFVDLSALGGQYIKIWALENSDDNALIYPVLYLAGKTLDIWLQKFEIVDVNGDLDTPDGDYKIFGHRKNNIHYQY